MAEIKIVICGCRNFHGTDVFNEFVDFCLARIQKDNNIVILSGHCSGVDSMAEAYANAHGLKVRLYPAEWAKYGKAAGTKRNMQMANDANMVIAFWDGYSKGTKSMIDSAEKLKKPVYLKKI